MAFYIYEQPAFSMEHFYPGFCRSLRSVNTLPMNRQSSLMENLFDQDSLACQSKTNEENKIIEVKTQTVSKPCTSKVACQETIETRLKTLSVLRCRTRLQPSDAQQC